MKKKQALESLAAINIALLLLFLFTGKKYFVSASLITSFFCLLFPPVLQFLHRAWNSIVSFAGSVNASILLAVLYFALLVPLALLYRVIKKQPLLPASDNYKNRDYLFTAKDFERPG